MTSAKKGRDISAADAAATNAQLRAANHELQTQLGEMDRALKIKDEQLRARDREIEELKRQAEGRLAPTLPPGRDMALRAQIDDRNEALRSLRSEADGYKRRAHRAEEIITHFHFSTLWQRLKMAWKGQI